MDDLPLVRLTKRLKCSQCGARAMKAERVPANDRAEKNTRQN
jgi:hypothetical protein